MLVVHLRSLEEGAVGNLIYQEQRVQDWPDLASETKVICEELDVEDCNITQIGKVQFRKYITKACLLKNEEILRKMAEGKEKCQRLTSESYGRKEYIKQKCIGESRNNSGARPPVFSQFPSGTQPDYDHMISNLFNTFEIYR